jgi:TPR repeat protein
MKLKFATVLCSLITLCPSAFGQPSTPSKYPDSLEVIKAKSSEGDPYYMAAYAQVLHLGEYGVKIDLDSSLKWAKKSASKGHPLGLFMVWRLEQDDELPPKFVDGIKQLAAGGSPRCQILLSAFLSKGRVNKKLGLVYSEKEAFNWATKAAEQGYSPSQSSL